MKKIKLLIIFLGSCFFNIQTLALHNVAIIDKAAGSGSANTSASSSNTTFEIRKINPPKLSNSHLGKKIICYRPMREGSPRMDVEIVGSKIIAHNYGHGGSGFTLAPGAAKYVVGLLEKEFKNKDLSKDTPITVVGAGVLGLFSAFELVEQGYKNITIVAEAFENLTSHNAGGLLAPVSMDNEPEMQKLIDKIGIDAYAYYKAIAQGKNPILKKGAIIVPTYFQNREDSGLEPYVGRVMAPAKDVILDFQNGTTQKMVAYDDGIFMDAGSLMASLRKALHKKVTFKKQKVDNLTSLSDPVIINCTGNGAKNLVNDQKVIPVQGHLIMLKNENPKDINYMILVYFGKDKTKSGFNVKRSFYIFPKKLPNTPPQDIGVIGGTFIEGADPKTPNTEEFEIMMKGARKFYGLDKKV